VLPKVSESLTGRVELFTLWPLSLRELNEKKGDLVTQLFDGEIPKKGRVVKKQELAELLLKGGYPEAVTRKDKRRDAWFSSYITTLLERDVRDIAEIQGLTKLPQLLMLIGSRSGGLLDYSDLSRGAGIAYATLNRYFAMLEAVYLVHKVPAWSSNIGLRLVKSPKVYMSDTGLLCSLLGVDEKRLENDQAFLGSLVETLVANELKKAISTSDTKAQLFHFRTHARQEVDFVLEGPGGELIGIEVKSSATVTADAAKGLKVLREAQEKKFRRGFILYAGEKVVPIDKSISAFPLSSFFGLGA
jgi:predicted AAA+ superfamily ATPase